MRAFVRDQYCKCRVRPRVLGLDAIDQGVCVVKLSPACVSFQPSAQLRELVRAVPSTKIGMLLEGGYDLAALEASLAASLDALVGGTTPAQPAAEPPTDGRHLAELERAERMARAHFRFG